MLFMGSHRLDVMMFIRDADQWTAYYSYLQMLNLSNEAIRRMYIACKDHDCFPGDLPIDEHDRKVSIHSILEGLGLLTDGMLPFDTAVSPSDESSSRRQSTSNASVRPPRANSGSSNQSMDGIDGSSLPNANAFPSSNSVDSLTSHHSFDDLPVSLTTQTNSCDSSQPTHDTGPIFLQNLDFLSFGPQSQSVQMASLVSTNNNVMEPLPNDFLFPWPGTFAAAMDSTEYQQQS
jgi:hypothetical protein